jgi:hypothetical protein
MSHARVIAFAAGLTLITSCVSHRDQPPERDGFVVHAYHYCPRCDSLQGGVYEKGPFKSFPGPNKSQCEHQWQDVPRERFTELATELHGIDWSREPMYFWRDNPNVGTPQDG